MARLHCDPIKPIMRAISSTTYQCQTSYSVKRGDAAFETWHNVGRGETMELAYLKWKRMENEMWRFLRYPSNTEKSCILPMRPEVVPRMVQLS